MVVLVFQEVAHFLLLGLLVAAEQTQQILIMLRVSQTQVQAVQDFPTIAVLELIPLAAAVQA